MQANDAMRILSSAAAMGLLGGGGALAYNATTKPILDEYGNVIESNDINPVMAALGSAAIGAVGSGIYGKMNQPVTRPVQGMSAGTSSRPRQSPDIDIDVAPTWQQEVQEEIDGFRNEVANLRGQLLQKRNDYAQGVNDLREASTPIRQVVPAKQNDLQGGTTSEKRFVPQLSSEQEALYAEAKRLGISPYELERRGWKYNSNQPAIQVVPASPMQMQNPMTPPGMRTVVIQPMKEPGQEMIEEALRLKELAYRQRQERQIAAKQDMSLGGWSNSTHQYDITYPEDNQYNVAGWDLVDPSPEAVSYRKELISDTNRYRQWYENQLEAQKKRA